MRRLVTAVVAVCVCLFGLQASTLHVHAYVDHDHEEHHHGPAAHDHEMSTDADEATHIEACDPSAHVVRVSCRACAGSDINPIAAVITAVAVVARAPVVARVVEPVDIRGHSPPAARGESLRAPPLQPLL